MRGHIEQTFHYDALGSVVGITQENGKADKNYDYDSYGQIEGNGNQTTGNLYQFSFTGQMQNNHSGLYEFYARAYDPTTGTWLQQDTYRGEIIDPMSLHRYGYVGNSPVNYFDSYGYELCAFGYCQSDLQEDVSNAWDSSVETFNDINNVYNEKKDQIYAEVENEVNQFIGHAGGGLETVGQFVRSPQSVVGQIDIIQLVNGEYDATLHVRLVTQSNIDKWTQYEFGDEVLTACSLGVTFIPGVGDYIDTAFATDEIVNGEANTFTYLSFAPFIPSKFDDAWGAGRKLLSRSDDGGGVISKIDNTFDVGNKSYTFTDHGYEAMIDAGLNVDSVKQTINGGNFIRYDNGTGPVTGFRLSDDGTFVAVGDDNSIVTVIENTPDNYLDNILKNPDYTPL